MIKMIPLLHSVYFGYHMLNENVTILGKHLTKMPLFSIPVPRQTLLIDHAALSLVSLDKAIHIFSVQCYKSPLELIAISTLNGPFVCFGCGIATVNIFF